MSNKKDLLALKLKLCTLALSSAVATSLIGCSQEYLLIVIFNIQH